MDLLRRNKVVFEPNCITREDGIVECQPILREGDIERPARIVLEPIDAGTYRVLKLEGDARTIEHLERFLQKRIIGGSVRRGGQSGGDTAANE